MRGWAILTVREATARRVKKFAHSRGLTVDELINQLLNSSGMGGWLTWAAMSRRQVSAIIKASLNRNVYDGSTAWIEAMAQRANYSR